MFQTLSTSEAADLLKRDSNASWSYSAAYALVEYLEEIEEGGEPIEFDSVAIRCEWSEYSSALEAAVDFGYEAEEEEEEKNTAAMLWLCDHATVIEFDGGVVVCGV